jgi:hypothetical protein
MKTEVLSHYIDEPGRSLVLECIAHKRVPVVQHTTNSKAEGRVVTAVYVTSGVLRRYSC